MASKCLINLLIGCLMLIVKGESQPNFEVNSNIKYDQLQKRRTISHNIFRTGTVYPKQSNPLKALPSMSPNIFRTGTVYPKQRNPLKALPPICTQLKCSDHCKYTGSGNGHCHGNRCVCDPITLMPEVTTPLFNVPRKGLNDKCGKYDCDAYCKQSGEVDGYCVGNSCQCNQRAVQSNKLPVPLKKKKEDSKRIKLAGCVESDCEKDCANKGLKTGHCACDKEYTLCRDQDWFCKCF